MSKYWDKVKWEDASDNSGPYESITQAQLHKALHKLNWKPTLTTTNSSYDIGMVFIFL